LNRQFYCALGYLIDHISAFPDTECRTSSPRRFSLLKVYPKYQTTYVLQTLNFREARHCQADNTSVSSAICHDHSARYSCPEDTQRTAGLSCYRTMTEKHTKNPAVSPYIPVLLIYDLAVIKRNKLFPAIFDVIQILMCFQDGSSVSITHEI
jgi:hypothetical protein